MKDESTDTADLAAVKKDAWTQTDDTDYDSDATMPYIPDNDCDSQSVSGADSDTTSEGSYTETYICDPDYTGPAYASQPCSKHGCSYTPPGWKRILVKRKRLEYPQEDEDDNN